jgi:hemoglobin
MKHAVGTLGLSQLDEAELWEYLERAAHSLLNTFED